MKRHEAGSVVKAAPEHIGSIAASIRPADRDELWAVACVSPEDGLRLSLAAASVAWTWFVDGAPVCMFGVSPDPVLQGVGAPWMIGTVKLDDPLVAMAFLRQCRPYLAEMFDGCVLLVNYVDARNITAIRWLKWLGFKFDTPQPTGPFGLPFHRFQMKRISVYPVDDCKSVA